MSTPEGAVDSEPTDAEGLSPGQLDWLANDPEGQQAVEQALTNLFGEDEDE